MIQETAIQIKVRENPGTAITLEDLDKAKQILIKDAQEEEFAKESEGYTAIKHQREVGVSYFDKISEIISSGESSTTAMQDSTESEQF